MSTKPKRRLKESIIPQDGLSVSIGGKPVTLSDINSSNDWRDYPGEIVIGPVRVMNRDSSNGVVYHDRFIRSAAKLHENNHNAAFEHEDTYATESMPMGRRPPETRFGRFFASKIVEDASGKAVAFDANVGVYEGDRVRAQDLAVKALRNPKSFMFSIEVDEDKWTGYADENGTIQAQDCSAMLDTCAVGFGGTTSSLIESKRPTKKRKRKTMAGESATSRLVESLNQRIQECGERENALTAENAQLKSQVDSLTAERDSFKSQLDQLSAKVTETEKREKRLGEIGRLAEAAGVKLDSETISRYSKFESDDDVRAMIDRDKKLQEGGGYQAPVGTPTGASGGHQDNGVNDNAPLF